MEEDALERACCVDRSRSMNNENAGASRKDLLVNTRDEREKACHSCLRWNCTWSSCEQQRLLPAYKGAGRDALPWIRLFRFWRSRSNEALTVTIEADVRSHVEYDHGNSHGGEREGRPKNGGILKKPLWRDLYFVRTVDDIEHIKNKT